MRNGFRSKTPAGVSLVETVVAVAVLAVAIPLSLAAMTKAGDETRVARAETRAPAIAEYVKMELEQARSGTSAVYGKLDEFPVLSEGSGAKPLGFSRDGSLIGPLGDDEYENGVRPTAGQEEVYFVALATTRTTERGTLVTVKIAHPAIRAAKKRKEVSFHTLLP
ncbi:Tfp pilus assembly protein FimT [Haloferula luteola]|uniref:Tfp pilus assembly protein FimT n=1 Tax=Haloferula luteola TaxID=595692 RepID=A0A840UVU3_9BACT|nr:hypothetical protein [Haloferula luteola]MBB5349902.1 Tfp pilus assembly protein FimT [Haloferula luteola]